MFFRKPHPWDGKYAIPDTVLAEPPGRGTATSRGLRRKTIDAPAIPPPWRTNYAYPNYVGQEPLGRGVYRTKYHPRKSIDVLVPQYLGDDDFSEGDMDPIRNFGQQVAAQIMGSIDQVPGPQRKQALKALFDQIDPKLWTRVASRGKSLERSGRSPRAALKQAIAQSTSMGLLEEFIRVGKTGRVEVKSMVGLAAYGQEAQLVVLEGMQQALGFSLNPMNWLSSGVRAATGPGFKAAEWGKKVAGDIGDLACNVAGSRVGQLAAGAGAASAGAPPEVGAKGASVISAACADQGQVPYAAPQKSSMLVPILLAAGAVTIIAVVALK